MKKLLKLKQRYSFAWDSALLMMAGGLSGILFFVFHAVMKRMMGEGDYASVIALLGLLNVLAVPMAAMTFTISRFVAEHVAADAAAVWVTIYKRAVRRITLCAAVALLVWVLLSPLLKDFFAAPSVLSMILLGLIALIRLYKPIITGVLQGSRRFAALGLVNILTPLGRVLLSALAVWLGARSAGVMGAVAVSILLSMAVGIVPFRRSLTSVESIPDYDTGPIYRYLFPVLLGQGSFLLLMNADLIFFKRFLFGEYKELAPAYAQAATLSRAVIFLAQPLATAMFPRAVSSERRFLLFGPLALATAASAGLALLISLFPEPLFKVMYETDNPDCFAIARLYVWAALPLTLVGMLLKYLWARHRTRRALVLIPAVLFYLSLLIFFHRTPEQIIGCLAAGSWTSLVLLIGAVLLPTHSRDEKNRMLVISLGGAGDTLMATPMLRELREACPEAQIDVLTMQGAVARDVLSENPNVSNHLHHDFMNASTFKSLAFCWALRRKKYDVSLTVMPQNRFEYNFITWLIGARERVGFKFLISCGAMGGLFLTKQIAEKKEHLVENNLRLLSEGLNLPSRFAKASQDKNIGKEGGLDLLVPDENFQALEKWTEKIPMVGSRLIGMHPGSGTTKNLALRRWLPERWAELCGLLGADPDVRIILFGSPDEAGLRREIIEKSGCEDGVIVEAPAGSILDTAALLKKMDTFVCCDTLLTHIAAALQVPQVVVMGPTPHWSVAPYHAPHRIARLGLECSPCYGYSKKGIVCTNKSTLACLKDLQPKEVVEQTCALMNRDYLS
jgi:heptosyltransferase-2